MNRVLKWGLLLAVPVGIAGGLIWFRNKNAVSIKVIEVRHEFPAKKGYPKGTLLVRTVGGFRFNQPKVEDPFPGMPPMIPRLMFVSAKVEDSRQRSVELIQAVSAPDPGDELSDREKGMNMKHIAILVPREGYDISKGGTLTVRMKVAADMFGRKPYWEGETTKVLPPMSH